MCEPCIDQIWSIWNETKAGEMAYAPCPDIPDISPPITGKSWSQIILTYSMKSAQYSQKQANSLPAVSLVKPLGISKCIENKGL